MQNKLFLNNLSLNKLISVYPCPIPAHNYPFQNRCRPHSGFVYTLEGTETYHFSYGDIKATPGSVLFLPKGESYKVSLEGERSVVAVIDFQCNGAKPRAFRVDFPDSTALKLLFKDLQTTWERKTPSYLPECKSTFYRIVALMTKQLSHAQSLAGNPIIEKAEQLLRENGMKRGFSLEELARSVGIGRRYLEALFLRRYGTTPKSYLLSLKMERAKELLLSEKLLVKDIALMLGYGDAYHFGKIFKAKTGYTPVEYRRSHGV